MKVINYFESDRREHWVSEIGKSDWRAGAFLHGLLEKDDFFETFGERSALLLLTDGDELISFCTYAERDDIPDTELTPWMGFVYTFPKYRGHRYAGLLFDGIERIARKNGVSEVYISTFDTGLYEKYGCEYLAQMKDFEGNDSRIYVKKID
ncbi:MAG: GNAT family N-acetyltransferase [Clostridia bacterium]|nr:GNAT family N-acetyltransferase [Clostridia bacterium]